MEQILLKALLRLMKNREVISDNQHGFTKVRSCLTNLVAFSDGVTTSVNKRRFMDVAICTSVRPLTGVHHNILLSKLETYVFSGWTV